MRRYLLDTSALAALLNSRPGAVALMRPWVAQHEAATSLLVYAEVSEYVRGRVNAEAHQRALRTLLREVKPYGLTYAILERYADLRRQLRPPHGPGLIGDIDTLIAATALLRGLTIVTTDTDYQRVPGLAVHLLTRAQLA